MGLGRLLKNIDKSIDTRGIGSLLGFPRAVKSLAREIRDVFPSNRDPRTIPSNASPAERPPVQVAPPGQAAPGFTPPSQVNPNDAIFSIQPIDPATGSVMSNPDILNAATGRSFDYYNTPNTAQGRIQDTLMGNVQPRQPNPNDYDQFGNLQVRPNMAQQPMIPPPQQPMGPTGLLRSPNEMMYRSLLDNQGRPRVPFNRIR